MEKVAPMLASADFNFEFKEPANLPNPMLAITDASFGYRLLSEDGDGEQIRCIVSGVNRSVLAGQRIGILGANGQGKSTVVKTIARDLGLLSGTITEGKGLNIGYFAQQELDVLRPGDTPLEHMVRLARDVAASGGSAGGAGREQDLRGFLGSFNFNGDMVKQPVGTMSGGEKARLVLAMMVWQRPNLLLMDEPTNHLDLTTREALAMALNEFEGTLMLVSHDRALLRSVCDEFWLVGRGAIKPFDGDLDDYQRYLLEESKRLREQQRDNARQAEQPTAGAVAPPVVQAPTAQRKADAQQRQLQAQRNKPLRLELDAIDARMAELNREKSQLETDMLTPGDSRSLANTGKRLKVLQQEIETLEERWLHLSEQLETGSAV